MMTGMVRRSGSRLDLRERFPSIFSGHVEIEKDDAGPGEFFRILIPAPVMEKVQELLAIFHPVHVIEHARLGESVFCENIIIIVILGKQNDNRLSFFRQMLTSFYGSPWWSEGSVKINAVPLPGVLSAVI